MDIIRDAWSSTDLPHGVVATIGNYDGVHRGQQGLLERVVERARELDVAPIAVTFDPHPLAVLRPGAEPHLLTVPAQKSALLEAAGIEAVLVVRFDRAFSQVTAEQFVTDLLVRRLAVREVLVGNDFRFGSDRRGDVSLLRQLGEREGFVVHGVDEVEYRGEPISSTRIRAAVTAGEMEAVRQMLGRPYELLGTVARGDRMGQRLGWPTVNVSPENGLLPQDGVYATQVRFSDLGAGFDSVTNIGTRPTVYENFRRVVESHVLDFSSDVYDTQVNLTFFKRLREERIFQSIMDLSAQIGRDVETAREYFQRQRRSGI